MATSETRSPRRARTREHAPSARKARTRKTVRRSAPANGLPSWRDLASKKGVANRRTASKKTNALVEGVPTLRFAGYVVAACALFTLYVGHVYATQELAAEVQQLQREHHRLVLKHNRLRGAFDRMTAPSVILDRAEALGLAPGSAYGPTISSSE